MNRRLSLFFGLAATALVGCKGTEINSTRASVTGVQEPSLDLSDARPTVITASCDITAAVADYRALLGAINPNVVGEQPGGRREINWDAVPLLNSNNNTFPADFFNQPVMGRARGA